MIYDCNYISITEGLMKFFYVAVNIWYLICDRKYLLWQSQYLFILIEANMLYMYAVVPQVTYYEYYTTEEKYTCYNGFHKYNAWFTVMKCDFNSIKDHISFNNQ